MSKTSKSGSNRRERLQDVACPFCSLLCDDLSLTVTKNKIVVAGNDCHRAKLGFEADSGHQYPQIEGQRVSQTAAIKAAVKLLHRGRRPLISGLGTDIEGGREAIHLAELSKAMAKLSALLNPPKIAGRSIILFQWSFPYNKLALGCGSLS